MLQSRQKMIPMTIPGSVSMGKLASAESFLVPVERLLWGTGALHEWVKLLAAHKGFVMDLGWFGVCPIISLYVGPWAWLEWCEWHLKSQDCNKGSFRMFQAPFHQDDPIKSLPCKGGPLPRVTPDDSLRWEQPPLGRRNASSGSLKGWVGRG